MQGVQSNYRTGVTRKGRKVEIDQEKGMLFRSMNLFKNDGIYSGINRTPY